MEQPSDPAAFYDARPWTARYGEGIPADLDPPRHRHLPALLGEAAQRYAAETAFTICLDNGLNASLSFAEVDRQAADFAAWLRHHARLEPGERVAVQMPNVLAYPVAAFGTLKAGGVLVNVNPLYTAPEMQHQLADSGARVLVLLDLFADKVPQALEGTAVEHVVLARIADFFPTVSGWVIRTALRLRRGVPSPPSGATPLAAALAAGARAPRVEVDPDPDDPAVLQYTGGTTGVSKGAVLRHRHLLANLDQVSAIAGPRIDAAEKVVLTALPLYHIFAFTFNLLTFYTRGGRNILCPSPRPVSNLKPAFERFPVTDFAAVNLLFHALLGEPWFQERPPRALNLSIAGGTALHRSVAERWEAVTGNPIHQGYGLTETSPVVAVNPPTGENRPESVGLPVPGTDLRIVDDHGQAVAPGEIGEIVVRGPQVFDGYWNRPDETALALRDGWFHTGDVGYLDPDGYVVIVDRKKDLIDVSGFNVYPNEVEDCLSAHPQVREVGVVGVPRGPGGETVVAVVAGEEDLAAEALIAFARERLAPYKVPRHIVFLDELPKSPVGKVLRKDLRATAEAAVAAED